MSKPNRDEAVLSADAPQRIGIAADHGGFELSQHLIVRLREYQETYHLIPRASGILHAQCTALKEAK
jgi:hypothetical protein